MESAAIEIHGQRFDHAPPARLENMKDFLARVSSEEGFNEQKQLATAYDRACASLIGDNDVQVEGDRTFKKKSAWRKLGRHFQLSTFVVASKIDYVSNVELEEDRLILVATCVVRAAAVWGQSSEAIGACGTDEESGQRVITIADALATAETRATNRAISNLIAMGEVSAEEVRTADGSPKSNGPPIRKQRPAAEMLMPFGPGKKNGVKLGEMDTKDLEGALRWAEDKSEEKGSPQFADFQKAAKEVLAEKKAAAFASAAPAGSGEPAAAPPAPTEPALSVDDAHKFPFPFQRDKPGGQYGKALGSMSSDHLVKVRDWILETAKEKGEPDWHLRTRQAIGIILEHREKDQGKLELGAADAAGPGVVLNKGTPFEATVHLCQRPAGHSGKHLPRRTVEDDAVIASMPEKGGRYVEGQDDCHAPIEEEEPKTPAAPSQSSQEAKTPAAAPSGGGPRKPGKVADALDPDPTSILALHARAKKALESPAISPEARENYRTDKINSFKANKGAKSLEWWVEALERTARMDPESFPSALEDTVDDLPF